MNAVPCVGRAAAWAWPHAALLLAVALLGGCASVSPTPQAAPPDAAAALRRIGGGPLGGPGALSALEAVQRSLAKEAAHAGNWLQAAWHWDAVAALRPGDAAAVQQRDAAMAQASTTAEAKLQQARRAKQRGDVDAAQRLYLEAVALVPEQAEALQALRAFERERVARQHLGQLSMQTLTRRDMAAALMSPEPPSVTQQSLGGSVVERANTLAEQGDVPGAIKLVAPLAKESGPAGLPARTQLADLHYRRAVTLAPIDPAGALSAVQESLRLNPDRAEARLLQQQLGQGRGRGQGQRSDKPAR